MVKVIIKISDKMAKLKYASFYALSIHSVLPGMIASHSSVGLSHHVFGHSQMNVALQR